MNYKCLNMITLPLKGPGEGNSATPWSAERGGAAYLLLVLVGMTTLVLHLHAHLLQLLLRPSDNLIGRRPLSGTGDRTEGHHGEQVSIMLRLVGQHHAMTSRIA